MYGKKEYISIKSMFSERQHYRTKLGMLAFEGNYIMTKIDGVAHQFVIHHLTCQCCRCDMLTILSHFLLVLNSSVNIVIYCWKVT